MPQRDDDSYDDFDESGDGPYRRHSHPSEPYNGPERRKDRKSMIHSIYHANSIYDRIITLIERVGVPAAILLFVIWRLEQSVRDNTEAIAQLRVLIARALPALVQ